MKPLLLLVTVLALHARLLAAPGVVTGPLTNPANGHQYYLLTQSHWADADQEARRMGGNLVTIDDEAEQVWVFSTFSTYGGVYRTLLIGLNDIHTEGVWRWSSGQPVTYTHWRVGPGVTEPNDGTNSNVAIMYPACFPAPSTWCDVGIYGESAEWCGYGTLSPFHGVVEIDPIRTQIEVSQVAFSWNSALNVKYQVQYLPGLGSGWSNLGGVLMGTGTNITVFDSILGEPRRFYRVFSVP